MMRKMIEALLFSLHLLTLIQKANHAKILELGKDLSQEYGTTPAKNGKIDRR